MTDANIVAGDGRHAVELVLLSVSDVRKLQEFERSPESESAAWQLEKMCSSLAQN